MVFVECVYENNNTNKTNLENMNNSTIAYARRDRILTELYSWV